MTDIVWQTENVYRVGWLQYDILMLYSNFCTLLSDGGLLLIFLLLEHLFASCSVSALTTLHFWAVLIKRGSVLSLLPPPTDGKKMGCQAHRGEVCLRFAPLEISMCALCALQRDDKLKRGTESRAVQRTKQQRQGGACVFLQSRILESSGRRAKEKKGRKNKKGRATTLFPQRMKEGNHKNGYKCLNSLRLSASSFSYGCHPMKTPHTVCFTLTVRKKRFLYTPKLFFYQNI